MEAIKLLKQLIKIKSYSGKEEKIKSFIQGWFKERNIKSFRQEENLFVHFKGKDRTRAFIFNSHLDTVSEGETAWKYGAWTPTIEGDRLIGLGASDMKSGLTSSMLLAEQVSKTNPEVDIWFTYVVKEEVDGSGTKSFADWFKKEGYVRKYKDVAGIFTEPTALKEIEYGHRGNLFLRVTSKGDSGHAARPNDVKKFAIEEMFKFWEALQKASFLWRKEFTNKVFTPPTVAMTSIQAGVSASEGEISAQSPNKIPSICSATFDVRATPEFYKVAFERVRKLGTGLGLKVEYEFPPAPAGYTDPSEKIVKVSKALLGKLELTVSQGSADLGFLSVLKVKAIIFGPGEKSQGHKVDEYCFPAQIPQAVKIYQQIIEAWSK